MFAAKFSPGSPLCALTAPPSAILNLASEGTVVPERLASPDLNLASLSAVDAAVPRPSDLILASPTNSGTGLDLKVHQTCKGILECQPTYLASVLNLASDIDRLVMLSVIV